MEFPGFEKEINGHQMFIEFTGDKTVEEAILWCQTCDPEGDDKLRQAVTTDTVANVARDLMQKAELHANPDLPVL